MTFRSAIPDFQLANPLYTGAEVSFFTVDVNGDKTAVLAPLFAGPTGATQLTNPQILDAEGKFNAAVYHSVPVIAEVTSDTADTVMTGIILPYVAWGGNWASGVLYNGNMLLRDPVNLSIYVTTTTYVSAGSIPTDVTAGNLQLVFQGESVAQATAAATAAANSAAAAAASAANAAAILASTARITGNANVMESGTTAQRPTPAAGVIAFRYNTTTGRPEMYVGSWGALIRSLAEIGDVDLSGGLSVGQGLVWNGTAFVPGAAGGGLFKGDYGTTGNRPGDIFRVTAQTLDADVIISGNENAEAPGPLTIGVGRTLTINAGGNLVIV